MRYVGEQLNQRYGFAVSGPRLAGHGTSVDDMETTGFIDWLNSAEEALKAPGAVELAYSEVPVGRLREGHLLFGLTTNLLPAIRCPTTVIQSREDHVVPARNALDIVNALTACDHVRLVWLNESYHVATLDKNKDKDAIVAHTGEFINFLLDHG